MRLQQFIDRLLDHGWESTHDAQWSEIKKFHAELFPDIAELEDELQDLYYQLSMNEKP